jgi:EamA domain-containing membrane protein RarD
MTALIAISITLGIVFAITIAVQFVDDDDMGFVRIMFMLLTIILILMLTSAIRNFKAKEGEMIKYEEKITYNKTDEGEFLPDTVYIKKLDK